MSLLLDVEGLPPSSTVDLSSATTSSSAFQRFASSQTMASQPGLVPTTISSTLMTSSNMIPTASTALSAANNNNSFVPVNNLNRAAAISPNSKKSDPMTSSTNHDLCSSPTSSTASDSQSSPTVRKKSHRKSGDDDDEDHETSQTDDNTFAWPTHSTYDEQRQLLGTEEESSDHVTSDDDSDLLGHNDAAKGGGGGGVHRSKNVWNITKEQLNYYTTQFFSMQQDPDGVIPGNQAKEFFEKSSLPISELRKIWQLSDVTMDGCLSLEEFLTAMHLVVLRRNSITLPDSLPTSLRPAFLKAKLDQSHKKQLKKEQLQETAQTEMGRRRHNKDLYEGTSIDHEMDHERLIDDSEGGDTAKEDALDGMSTAGSGSSSLPPLPVSPTSQQPPSVPPLASESETGSVLSSPGGRPTPVNFDFHRPDAKRDPHIVQPVAVRLSPESPVVQSSDVDEDESDTQRLKMIHRRQHGVGTRDVGYEQLWNAGKDADDDDDDRTDSDSEESEVETRRYGPVSLPAHAHVHHHHPAVPVQQQQQQQHPLGLGKKEGTPPPPPPRTSRSHTRSSSLDLNRYPVLRHGVQQQPQPPPAVPPRYLPTSADASATPSKAGSMSGGNGSIGHSSTVGSSSSSRDARAMQISIHEYRERNSLVARTINELHQEWSDALEERIALEYQLEQLKSFGD